LRRIFDVSWKASRRQRRLESTLRQKGERALAIREKVLGAEHPDTVMNLNAVLLQAQGDLAGARPLLERALAMGFGPSN